MERNFSKLTDLVVRIVLCVVILAVGCVVNVSAATAKKDSAPSADGVMTVDLVIFAGQSNMSGGGGNAKAAPAVAHGCGYEYRNGQSAPGLYEVEEPFGTTANGYICDPEGLRQGTLVSAFMNKYYNATGVPVVGVSASRGGTGIYTFWNSEAVRQELVNKYLDAIAYCNSNHIYVRNRYVVWLQGETDAIALMSGTTYQAGLDELFAPLFLRNLDQVFIVTIGNFGGLPGAYDEIVNAQINKCKVDARFTLGTTVLHDLPDTYTVDGVHYNQTALNMAGEETAAVAALFSAAR